MTQPGAGIRAIRTATLRDRPVIGLLVVLAALLGPGLLLVLFSIWPALDLTLETPLQHFHVVTFVTFTAAVVSILLTSALAPIARPRYLLAAVAFAYMGTIFFTHGFATPGALIAGFHPAVQWSAWLTLFGGGAIFALACLDGAQGRPSWLSVRAILIATVLFSFIYVLIIAFAPQWLLSANSQYAPWHGYIIFYGTLGLWLVAAVGLARTWLRTRGSVDAALMFVAVWLFYTTISMHRFPTWHLSWWLYHFLLLASFLLVTFVLLAEFEQARQFRLLPYYLTIALILTALLALLASQYFAGFTQRLIVADLEAAAPDLAAIYHASHDAALPPDAPAELLTIQNNIISARRTSLVMVSLMMGLLFGTLSLVIRRADRIITNNTRELATAYADLRRSEQGRQELLNMIIHDLRNPLTLIGMTFDLLLDTGSDELTDLQRRYLSRGHRATHRMDSLIGDMLSVSKMEAGELVPRMENASLARLMRERVDDYTDLATAEDKRVKLDVPSELTVRMDPDLIGRVIENLLSNAFKATQAGTGEITVSAARQNGRVEVRVEDNGPGVPDAEKSRIFEKFVQLSHASGRTRSGTGLGLAFCRLVVEAHQGGIWAEDAAGGGAAFVFTLPEAKS